MFVFGIVMALLGAILPALAARLEFQVADIGTLFLAMNGAMLAASLVLGLAMDRFGMKPPLALGPLLVAGALMMLARATAFRGLLPAVLLLGVGGGALNGAANTLVADLHDDPGARARRSTGWACFFGFGALLMPFAIGSLLARFSLAALLRSAAAVLRRGGSVCGGAGLSRTQAGPCPARGGCARGSCAARWCWPWPRCCFSNRAWSSRLGGFISTYLTRDLGTLGGVGLLGAGGLLGVADDCAGGAEPLGRGREPVSDSGCVRGGRGGGRLLAAVAPGPGLAAGRFW